MSVAATVRRSRTGTVMAHRRSPAASDLARCRCRRGGWWRGGGDLHVSLRLAVLEDEQKAARCTRAEGREGGRGSVGDARARA